jgi:hypothetical protein
MIMPSAPASTAAHDLFVAHAPGANHKSHLVQPFQQISIQEVGVGHTSASPMRRACSTIGSSTSRTSQPTGISGA